jgi:membrane-bound lytic murein transglycosylase A
MVHHTIKPNINSAPKASSNNHSMNKLLVRLGRLMAGSILGTLAACSSPPSAPPVASEPVGNAAKAASSAAPASATVIRKAPTTQIAGHVVSQWLPVDWAEIPAWDQDDLLQLWPALHRSCQKPPPDWRRVCREVHNTATPQTSQQARAWLTQRLRPYRVQSLDGNAQGLITGYFEPQISAQRRPNAVFRFPVYAPPANLSARKPYWSRQELQTLPQAQAELRGREMAYLDDPLEALSLQVQGSGRVQLIDKPGKPNIRLAFAAHNGHPYQSIGRWLIAQGALHADQATWPAMRAWALLNPERVGDMLASNPRVVFFREESLINPDLGPKGSQSVALTPGRSIAVDPLSIPYGSLVWLDTTEPLSNTPLQRAVMAQDGGAAIKGAVRADYFWGWGDEALRQAGRMKQALRLWVLWPRDEAPGK